MFLFSSTNVENSLSVCTCAKCGSSSLFQTLYALISGSRWHRSGPPYVHEYVKWNFPNVTSSPVPGKLHLIMTRDPVERYVSAFHSKVKCCSDNRTSCYQDRNDHFVPQLAILAGIAPKNCLTFDEYVNVLERVHRANKQSSLTLQTTKYSVSHPPTPTVREAENSLQCLKNAFGHDVNITIINKDHPTCAWKQHGNLKERECWCTLMKAKMHAVRNSPYDVTAVIDSDVFANPKFKEIQRLPFEVLNLFRYGAVDMYGVYGSAHYDGLFGGGALNGGFYIVLRNARTDRFFECVAMHTGRMIEPRDKFGVQPATEQFVMNLLLQGDERVRDHSGHTVLMQSLQFRVFPPRWVCRYARPSDATVKYRLPNSQWTSAECAFTHSHNNIVKCTVSQ